MPDVKFTTTVALGHLARAESRVEKELRVLVVYDAGGKGVCVCVFKDIIVLNTGRPNMCHVISKIMK